MELYLLQSSADGTGKGKRYGQEISTPTKTPSPLTRPLIPKGTSPSPFPLPLPEGFDRTEKYLRVSYAGGETSAEVQTLMLFLQLSSRDRSAAHHAT